MSKKKVTNKELNMILVQFTVHCHVILQGNGDKIRLFNVFQRGLESCFTLNLNLIEPKKIWWHI